MLTAMRPWLISMSISRATQRTQRRLQCSACRRSSLCLSLTSSCFSHSSSASASIRPHAARLTGEACLPGSHDWCCARSSCHRKCCALRQCCAVAATHCSPCNHSSGPLAWLHSRTFCRTSSMPSSRVSRTRSAGRHGRPPTSALVSLSWSRALAPRSWNSSLATRVCLQAPVNSPTRMRLMRLVIHAMRVACLLGPRDL
mmetsp:Transcript_8354/g.21884  ORF Transcript_8354/g.21884 Transcript_8354/m.21884 type:complete len:200 (+) Transcript_8354:350-949(+)